MPPTPEDLRFQRELEYFAAVTRGLFTPQPGRCHFNLFARDGFSLPVYIAREPVDSERRPPAVGRQPFEVRV